MPEIRLYEDNAGNLYVRRESDGRTYDATPATGHSTWLADRVSLADGDEGNWTLEETEVPHHATLVAWWDQDSGEHVVRGGGSAAWAYLAPTLRSLLDLMRTATIEDRVLPDLPTYGGSDLSYLPGPIWSWDKTHAIVGSGTDDLYIVARAAAQEAA